MTTRSAIESFLSEKRIAIIGVSRNDKHFTRVLWKAFRDRGYDVVPVNPAAPVIDGVASATEIGEVKPPVTAALVATPPSESAVVVEECVKAGIRKVWLYGSVNAGCATPKAVALVEAHNLEAVEGECPLMWLPNTEWFHGVHKGLRGLFGRLPA